MFTPRETWRFDTERIGRRALVYDCVASTNSLGGSIATSEDADGLVLIAEEQSAGRGQYGRVWQSRPGTSLLMSVVLRPPPELRRPVVLTAWAAVSIAEAILALTGIQVRLKWPNDLLLRGKKCCGILIEQTSTQSDATAVLGIGLNLNQTAKDFADAELPEATSLGIASEHHFETQAAARMVIHKLDQEYSRLLAGERTAVEADWKWRVGLLGRTVVIEHLGGEMTTGRLRDMAFEGVEVETSDGAVRVVMPESISHVRALE